MPAEQLSWVISLCVRNGRKIKQKKAAAKCGEMEEGTKEVKGNKSASSKQKQEERNDFEKQYPLVYSLADGALWSVNWRIAYFCNLFALE